MNDWIEDIAWNAEGLVPAVAQDAATGEVLTLAWMNREALAQTASTREATYWSRSRRALWKKGETSGHRQRVVEIRLDCDADCVLLRVESVAGIACHTGRRRCFFNRLDGEGGEARWVATDPVLADPASFRRGPPGPTGTGGE
jgi:phosphoribosyl-AMP cyclohydrolase